MYNQVDRFIIIEGNKYFNGESKKKIFNISNFVKYEKKIEYYFVEDFPKHDGNNWNYEFYQRNQISRGLKDLNKDDYVLVSDVDEIPKLDKKLFLKHDSLVFMQKMFYYKFNIHYHEGLKWNNKWPGTKGCKYKFFKSAQKIRNFRNKNIPWWRFDRKIKRHVKWDGGWHFAYLMNNEDISNKLNRFDHEISHLLRNQNYNKMNLMDKKEINLRIKNLRDPYNRKDVKLKKVNIDKTYPKFIYENIDKLSEFID